MRCAATTKAGKPCQRNALKGQETCSLHGGDARKKRESKPASAARKRSTNQAPGRARDWEQSWLADDVAAFKASGDELPSTEDILIAFWVAMRRCPQDPSYLGVFKSLASGALDVRRQLYAESGGGRDLTGVTITFGNALAEPSKPRPE